jgi:hypothetical protein
MDDREAIKVMVYAPKDRPVSASHADKARGALNKLPCRTSQNAVWAKFGRPRSTAALDLFWSLWPYLGLRDWPELCIASGSFRATMGPRPELLH